MSASLLDTFLNASSIWHPGRPATTELEDKTVAAQSGPLTGLVTKPASTIGYAIRGLKTSLYGSYPTTKEDLKHRINVLYLNLSQATTVEEWRAAASELDALEGNNAWKNEFESDEYDPMLVQTRLHQLEDARINFDAKQMLFHIRTALTRHLGGMGNLRLYQHSHIGTKSLIEEYIASSLATLSSLLDITSKDGIPGLDSRYLLEQVLAARQAFGRSALLLSGGGTLGMYHIGIVKTLWEAKLLPRIISGSSAGSIVCAVLCARIDEEVPGVEEELLHGDLDVFTKVGEDDSPMQQIARLLKHGAFFDSGNLKRVMRSLLGDITFQEAYNRTRRILNICVSSAGIYESPRLLNYVTAPNVVIWSAVAASCSVPGIFVAEQIQAKDPVTGEFVPWNDSPDKFIDGSVYNDLPMTRLAEMFNVNHFIVSQVNPHVIPFLTREEDGISFGKATPKPGSNVPTGPGILHRLAGLAREEAMHRMQVMSEIGIFPNLMSKTRSVLSQRYSGDITIVPEIPYSQFLQIMQNPSVEFIYNATASGERATWPKLSRIQNHCAIELALDDAVQQLRARVAFSPSQVDLRLFAVGGPLSRAVSEGPHPEPNKSLRKRRKFTERLPLGSPSKSTTGRREPVSFHLPRGSASSYKVSENIGNESTDASDLEDSDYEPGFPNNRGTPIPYGSSASFSALTPSTRLAPWSSQPNTPSLRDSRRKNFSPGSLAPTPQSPETVNSETLKMTTGTRKPAAKSRSATHSRSPSHSGLSLDTSFVSAGSEIPAARRSRSGRSTPKRLSWALKDDVVAPES